MYDAIIVGAGPAGGMAARKLAEKGYKVLIIEKKRKVGVPVQCGEAITHFGLMENGIAPEKEWIKQKVAGAKPIMPDGVFFYVKQDGYSIVRDKFDQWNINAAFDKGAVLMLRNRAKGVVRAGKNWKVSTAKGDFEGKILIGADGPSSNVASSLGMLHTKVFVRAMEYKFRSRDFEFEEKDWLSFFMGVGWNGGYAWVFPRDDEWNVGVGGFGNTPESLKKFLKMLKVDKDLRIGEVAGLVPRYYKLTNLAVNGLMIVGDAAGMTNPIIGGGIHAGLSTGRIAGEVAVKSLENETPELTMQYEKRINKEPYVNPVLHQCANYFRHWTDADWNFLGWMMKGKDQSELTLLKGVLRTLQRPRYLPRGRELLRIRKAMRITMKYGW